MGKFRSKEQLEDDIDTLYACLDGDFTGEIWEHPELLRVITDNGYLIEVHTDVAKSSVKTACWGIIELLEEELGERFLN